MAYNPTVNNVNQQAQASGGGKFFWYLTFILIIPIFIHVSLRNNLFRQKQRIEETASGIDVQLKRRVDLLTKLVDATKQYMTYEKETLSQIVALRSRQGTISPEEFSKVNDQISQQLGNINVQLERYPDLKASNNVMQLQNAIKDCEDNIAAARRFYNSEVRDFNARLFTWPSNVAASSMKLSTYFFFEASEQDRQDVKIDLGYNN